MPEDTTVGADLHTVRMTVNGEEVESLLESRVSLADYLRHGLGLKGTHLGCEQGSCGACTVIVDGAATRSCLLFAVQLGGANIETVESLAVGEELSALQQALHEHHGLQCGFCTSGFLMSLTARLRERPIVDEHDAREALSGNICRCTGYAGMVEALLALAGPGSRETER